LIVYSDPQDDGFFRGDVYPKGRCATPTAFSAQHDERQRRSTTPSWSSVAALDASGGFARYPRFPSSDSYGNARASRAGRRRPSAELAGALRSAITWAGPLRATCTSRRAGQPCFHSIWNTIGSFARALADEWVSSAAIATRGAQGARQRERHRHGARGARTFATLPRKAETARSILFATWTRRSGADRLDGVGRGAGGFTQAHVVAYINEDGTFSRPTFSGGARRP